MKVNRYSGVEPYAAFFVSFKVKTLIRTPFFNFDDYEDLEQELMLAYLLAEPLYDSSKGHYKAYVKSVINNRARNIILEAERQKRWSGQKEVSLSSRIGNREDAGELIELIADEDWLGSGCFSSYSMEALEIELDAERLVEQMPEDIRDTYELLKNCSITEAAELMGISRTTLSSRAQKLKKYLQKLQEEEK